MVIDGWVGYINQQFVTSAYMAEQICNFDETNIDFDPAPCNMLSKISEWTVSLWVNGHSGRCTIMSGGTASESSSLHLSYGRVFGMAAFTGIVSRMCFLGTISVRCNLVGGWMEKHFRNGCSTLSSHLQRYTTIAFTIG
jgi:hypothetical protein